MRKRNSVVLVLLAALVVPSAAMAVPVDLELLLAIDVSGSVNSNEYDLQMQGYQAAFNNPLVMSKIDGGTSVAVAVVLWSGDGQAAKVVDWTLLSTGAESAAFGDSLPGVGQLFQGNTAPQEGINLGVTEILNNSYEGTRLVIDVSGDGAQNDPDTDGGETRDARDSAAANSVTVNGLAILTDQPNLDDWYNDNVRTTDGFVVAAADFNDFERAVNRKVLAEVSGVIPEPMTMAAMFMGVAGLAGYIRKRRAA